MMLRQPRFWYDRADHPLALLLSPLSYLWSLAGILRARAAKPYTASMPVICLGNVTVGGSGKTPAALAIAAMLKDRRVCFLTRGYGGQEKGPVVIENAHDATLYGDEALLLSRHAPTIVARDRVRGLKLAEARHFDVVIVDDGFQNPGFTKTLSLLVIDGASGVGNGRVMPAGPLREPVADAIARADAALVIGDTSMTFGNLPALTARFVPTVPMPDTTPPYVAFAGIGRPEKFFDTLVGHGYTLAETVSFPDHHVFSAADLDRLYRLAARHEAKLITTEKDFVRLPRSAQDNILSLPVTLEITGDIQSLIKRAVP